MAARVPAKPKPAASLALKRLRKKSHDKKGSFREFVRTSEDERVKELAENWLHNKTANFSKPPQGIGNTRKKKNRN